MPLVFDRSFRGDQSRAGSGSGLGLAIAKAAAEAQGAGIGVSRDAESGMTTFSISFTTSLPTIR
jgi:signal transduction histidine kinase